MTITAGDDVAVELTSSPAASSAASGESAATGSVAVRIDGVSKRFGKGPVVLDNVSIDVAPGEFVCVLGASGCGKSTLLNLIAGLEKLSAGSIDVGGARPALMFQEPALYPWLTGRGNVELALRLGGMDKAARKARAQELLELVRLSDVGNARPHELSGGMRQRVAMARALAQDASVLLMDEPFAALDAITRDALHDELERVWHETGLTIMFVTHNVREAIRLGQRIVLLSSRPGRVLREWQVGSIAGRKIGDPEVADLAREITDALRAEIARHAH